MADVAKIFDDACIESLRSYLPRAQDTLQFTEQLCSAARAYADNIHALSSDEVRAEISELLDLANFRKPTTSRATGVKYEKVALKLERLSDKARRMLTDRAVGMSQAPRPASSVEAIGRNGEILKRRAFAFTIALPSPGDLRNPMLREKACETVITLCLNGARAGKRGIEYDLHAPNVAYQQRSDGSGGSIRKRRPKRKPELEFVTDLRLLWVTATGEQAAWTANSLNPGPFVRFAAACLELVGAYDESNAEAGASRILGEIDRRRRIAERQSEDARVRRLADE